MDNNEFENFEDIARIVSLKQILEMDSTLFELAEMPVGHYAIRSNKKTPWKIYRQE